jgi:hypothetical protein
LGIRDNQCIKNKLIITFFRKERQFLENSKLRTRRIIVGLAFAGIFLGFKITKQAMYECLLHVN